MFGMFSRGDRDSLTKEEPSADYASGPRAPERPAMPRPEGLNRNALTIAAVIMGTIVIAAVVFMQPSRPFAPTTTKGTAPPPLDQGTFLDQPPVQSVRPDPRTPSADSSSTSTQSPGERQARPSQQVVFDSPYTEPVTPAVDVGYEERMQAFRAGLVSPVRGAMTATEDPRSTPDPTTRIEEARQLDSRLEPRDQSPILARAIPSSSQLDEATERQASTHVRVDWAPSPYAVQAGTMIPAVLITEVNSDVPGQVLAQVARDVYDTRSQQTLLIPRGAKLIGSYEDQVPIGRDRLLMAWTRVLLPDGRSISLPGLPSKDRAGAGGVSDRVDRHVRRTFGTTALLSLIGAGLQLSQPRGATGVGGYYPSVGEVAAGAVGQQLAEVATQLLKRDLDARPTIRIRQGLQFNVFLNTDLVFQEPYDRRR